MPTSQPAAPTATRLRTEFLVNPLGIGNRQPRLSWWMQDDRPAARQTAYRIRVASRPELLTTDKADLWDSGRVDGDQSVHIAYAGKTLGSRTPAVWDVTLWDADAKPLAASQPATFETGLLEPSDWTGKWIGTPLRGTNTTSPAVPWLRTAFNIDKPIKSARLYITALGLYQAHLNGQRIGDDYFRPGWTEYKKRVQYQTYDVTALLAVGANRLGAMLGDGWYVGRVGWGDRAIYWGDAPALRAQLEITHDDGSRTVINTDEKWEWRASPILSSDFMAGEDYDARLEDADWCRATSSATTRPAATQWQPAIAMDISRDIEITAQPNESVRLLAELPAIADPNRVGTSGHRTGFIYDLGQNFAGIARLKIKGPAGATVRLRYAEMLNKNGTLYTENLRAARVTDYYTLRGDPDGETFTPTFTFHGFRYVELAISEWHLNPAFGQLIPPPGRDAIVGLALGSDTPKTGEFECSEKLLNQLQHNIFWGQRSNFLEAPTDCPQRDERLGWTGDAQVFAPTAAFNMDVAAFFTKWTQDCDDAQLPDGGLPVVVPITKDLAQMGDGAAGWSDVRVIAPWTMYEAYADRGLLERHYPAMKKWIEFQRDTAKDGGVRGYEGFKQHRGFGDWLALDRETDKGNSVGATPLEFIGTAYYARSAGIMQQIAQTLGKTDDAAAFGSMRDDAVAAFNKNFVKDDGTLSSNTQTAHLMALAFDLLPEAKRQAVLDQLIKLIADKDNHLSTGFLGTPLLLPTLTRFGKLDLAYKILMQTTYPGWLFTVSIGATTMWERWNSWTPTEGFGNAGMNSFNHYAYGAVGRWMYDTIGGLAIDPAKPGYKHAIIAPRPGGGITSARTALDSIHGRFETSWKVDGGAFVLDVVVPANTSATVTLPDGKSQEVVAGRHTFKATV